MADLEGLARTAEHAARGKYAAVSEGYWPDAYARYFSCGGFDGSPGPLINRGQYARIAAITSACEQFLAAVKAADLNAQIVSLGAGFDTCFWQLSAAGAAPRLFVEIDQESIVQRKSATLATKKVLQDALQPERAACVTPTGVTSGGSGYRLVAADLNQLDQLEAALDAAGWRRDEPTLILAECVLCYLRPEASSALIRWFGERASRAVLAAYEMVGPDDPFGRTMLENLRRRGCPLLSLPAVPDVRAQEARCVREGFSRAEALEMLAFFDEVVGPEERQRVCRLSLLDELEEWRMLMSHYCFVLAVKEAPDGPPLFGELQLRAPVLQPPFEATSRAAPRAVAIGDEDDHPQADALGAGRSSRQQAPPLGGPYFDEADEDAVWSDEEEQQAGGVPEAGAAADDSK